MKVVIDTNSLISLVRYYLGFDKNDVLVNFIKEKLTSGEIIIIDEVFKECKQVSGGIVLHNLKFLDDKEFLKSAQLPYKTDKLIAPSPEKFLRQVESNFVNTVVKNSKNITDVEFERMKEEFLESADMKQIILCLTLIKGGEDAFLITEETEGSNDNKLFKKIPAICKILNINTLKLPELLEKYEGINIVFQ